MRPPPGSGCGTIFSLSVGLGPFVETQTTSGKVGAAVKILGSDLTGATSVSFTACSTWHCCSARVNPWPFRRLERALARGLAGSSGCAPKRQVESVARKGAQWRCVTRSGLAAGGPGVQTWPAPSRCRSAVDPKLAELHFLMAKRQTEPLKRIQELKLAADLDARNLAYWQALAEAYLGRSDHRRRGTHRSFCCGRAIGASSRYTNGRPGDL